MPAAPVFDVAAGAAVSGVTGAVGASSDSAAGFFRRRCHGGSMGTVSVSSGSAGAAAAGDGARVTAGGSGRDEDPDGSGLGRRTCYRLASASACSTCGMMRYTLPQPRVITKSPSRATDAV